MRRSRRKSVLGTSQTGSQLDPNTLFILVFSCRVIFVDYGSNSKGIMNWMRSCLPRSSSSSSLQQQQQQQQQQQDVEVKCGSAFGASGNGGSNAGGRAAAGTRHSPPGFMLAHKRPEDLPNIQILNKQFVHWQPQAEEQQFVSEEVDLICVPLHVCAPNGKQPLLFVHVCKRHLQFAPSLQLNKDM